MFVGENSFEPEISKALVIPRLERTTLVAFSDDQVKVTFSPEEIEVDEGVMVQVGEGGATA